MIYDVNSVDVVGERKDGGLDMFIISIGGIDASPGTQKLLLDKVERYLGYVNSKDFIEEFPEVEKSKVQIILELEENAPELLLKLCEKIIPWAEDNGVRLRVKQKN